MVEKHGNFEVNFVDNFVRLPISETEYKYIVSKEIYGEKAHDVARMFVYAFEQGRYSHINELKKVLGV